MLPIANQYIPLTLQQRLGVTSVVATPARDARVANETLTVAVSTGADTSTAGLAKTAGVDAYETRVDDDEDDTDGEGKNGIFDLNPNVKPLGGKACRSRRRVPRACRGCR